MKPLWISALTLAILLLATARWAHNPNLRPVRRHRLWRGNGLLGDNSGNPATASSIP